MSEDDEEAGSLAELPLVDEDRRWMGEALAMAEKGLAIGELPIGAVVVVDGRVVGRAFTQEATQGRLLVHAELLALDQADRTIGFRKGPAVLYTTLEPCLMCMGAASVAVIGRVVFALESEADGAGELSRLWDEHRLGADLPHVRLPPVVGGVRAEESRALFARFVATRPSPDDPLARWAASVVVAGGPPAGVESSEAEEPVDVEGVEVDVVAEVDVVDAAEEPLPVDDSGDE